MDCSDYTANRQTTGAIEVGTPETSVFHLCNGSGGRDEDWFRIELEYGKTYEFALHVTVNYDEPPRIRIVDQNAIVERRYDRSGPTFLQFTAREDATYFFKAAQGGLPDNTGYLITSRVLTNEEQTGVSIRLWPGFENRDALETDADSDRYLVKLYAGRTYNFAARGVDSGYGSLPDPQLKLWSPTGQLLVEKDDGGVGRDAGFFFRPTVDGDYQVWVSGDGTAQGSYSVMTWLMNEAIRGTGTKSQLTFGLDGLATKHAFIGTGSDVDWHSVALKKGQLIRVTVSGFGEDLLQTPTMVFRDPNGSVINMQSITRPKFTEASTTLRFNYEVPETGVYFVDVHSAVSTYVGGYQAEVRMLRTPLTQKHVFGRGQTARLISIDQSDIALQDLFHTQGFEVNWYEVFSPVPLHRNGSFMEANRRYAIPGDELHLWKLTRGFDEQEELFIRARASNSWSQWSKFPIFGMMTPDGLDSGQAWDGSKTITYNFVTDLPGYYTPGEFTSFESVQYFRGVGRRVIDALDRLTRDSGIQLQLQRTTDPDADINIFLASGFAEPTMSFLPGNGRGGDIILNSASFSNNSEPQIGSRNFFTLLKTVGRALGLGDVAGLSQAETIMGSVHGGLNPTGPGNYDLAQLAMLYGTSTLDPTDTVASASTVWINAERTITTIAVEASEIAVDPIMGLLPVRIDLRDGQQSRVVDTSVVASQVYVGVGASVYNATGSFGNDTLIGNGLSNTLNAGDGNDFLIGHEGFDRLFGGRGDDIYIHYFGDGRDFITDSGGTDTLCFFGRDIFEVDDLAEDYTFTRHGNQLTVELTLDGGAPEGQVDIWIGNSGSGRIESLELWHGTDFTARISMANILAQLADGQTSRFRALTDSDAFGNLVTPL